MTHRETVDKLKGELSQRLSDPDQAGQAVMNLSNEYGLAVGDLRGAGDYSGAERLLADWRGFLDEHQDRLSGNGARLARARFEDASGNFWQTRALFDYYLKSDFVSTPRLFEQAEGCFERAVAQYREIDVPPDQQGFRELRDSTIKLLDAGRLDVRGMKLFVEGEFEREAGDLVRAERQLREAIAAMREGAANVPAGEDPGSRLAPLFLDYAEAGLQQALSEKALLLGNPAAAAAAEENRANALDRCQAVHARLDPATNQTSLYWAARLARDAFIARQRHERLDAAAARQPRAGVLNKVMFVVIAVGIVIALLGGGLYLNFDAFKNPGIVSLMLAFAVLIGGVGAGLATWADVADRMQKLIAAAKPGDKKAG